MKKQDQYKSLLVNRLGNIYKISEVATYLRVSSRSVSRLIETGKLKATGKGRNTRISEAELRRFLRLGPDNEEKNDNTQSVVQRGVNKKAPNAVLKGDSL